MGFKKLQRPIITPPDSESVIPGVGGSNFSTGVYDTGRKWIDGKTIWGKVVSDVGSGTYTANANTAIAHGLVMADVDRVVALSGVLKRDSVNESIPLPFGSSAGIQWCIDLFIRDTSLFIRPGSGWTPVGSRLSDGVFLIEYTLL